MERRSFLKALTLAIVAPVIAKVNLAEAAAVMPSNPYQKYITGLELFDAVLAETRNTGEKVRSVTDRYYETFGTFITFMNENFPDPGRDQMVTSQLNAFLAVIYKQHEAVAAGTMNAKDKVTCHDAIKKVPPEISDFIWPVVALKSLLSEYRVPINTSQIKGFDVFVARYSRHIVS